MSPNDDDVVELMTWCKRLHLTVHIRGTDQHPVMEFRHKGRGRYVCGYSELKKLILRWKKSHAEVQPSL